MTTSHSPGGLTVANEDAMNWTETQQQLIKNGIAAKRLPGEWRVGIDLREAVLSEADLREADLREADLSRAIGPFTTGSFGQHTAIAAGGYIAIGCERHDYDWWLANYEECGQRNYYAPEEIAEYGAWIQLAVARQRRIEQPEAAAREAAIGARHTRLGQPRTMQRAHRYTHVKDIPAANGDAP